MNENDQCFRPPVLVGERVAWLGGGSGLPQPATVRWIGRIPEITQGWTVGLELDKAMPVGGIDGTWRKRKLFSCEPKRGLLVPIDKVVKESSLLKTRHSLGENFYNHGPEKRSEQSRAILKQLSLPQSNTPHEFLAKVLPQSDATRRTQTDVRDTAVNFKQAIDELHKRTEPIVNLTTPKSPNPTPLTIENVKAFDVEIRSRNESQRRKTIEELEKFKKHLDEWEKFNNSKHESSQRPKKISRNPESLYSLAQSSSESQNALFLRIIGEKSSPSDEKRIADLTRAIGDLKKYTSPRQRRKETVLNTCAIPEETVVLENSIDQKTTEFLKCDRRIIQDQQKVVHKVESSPKFVPKIKEANVEILKWNEGSSLDLVINVPEQTFAVEIKEENPWGELVQVSPLEILTAENESESVSGPTPTIRKKKLPPVPLPRRRSSDGPRRADEEDTTSVLYEPAFLTEYMRTEVAPAMSDVRGTFRRIDEDEIERFPALSPTHPKRRPLTASLSVPDSSKKGIFSFLKWFRKEKRKDDLGLEDFNAPSIAGSPLFTRRLANATSVDTLYSIATVSSFAFVSGAQYQSCFGSDKRKKRRAPQPPEPQKIEKSDCSLPNTLEKRGKQQHRRSVSESYKDRKSGAFAHVSGKRRAPVPPRDRLYPTLSSVEDDSITRKKRPAPLPPVTTPGVNPLVEQTSPEVTKPEICVPATPTDNVISEIPPVSVEIVIVDTIEEPSPILEAAKAETSDPVKDDQVVCNDTLRLERGVLKANKIVIPPPSSPGPTKLTPSSPVSPRPWYKRKSLEKRKEKSSNDWMPEVGIPRPLSPPDSSPLKFNFFSRSEDKKKEDKRKSGLSLLANISELDREAAEICRNNEAHKLLGDGSLTPPSPLLKPETEVPKRNSTKELISMFNAIGIATNNSVSPAPWVLESSAEKLTVAKCDQTFIKQAAVVETKCLVPEIREEPREPSRAQAIFEQRTRQLSPAISTITETSEPSSSAATLNHYTEAVWKCTRCTLENLNWKNRCDACSSCKPDYKPKRMSERRKSEMELEIDWEMELQKYFPAKAASPQQVSSKLVLSKDGDVSIETKKADIHDDSETKQAKDENEKETRDPKEGDVDEIRRKRLAFFMRSFSQETSLREAASKKSLDESEKLKLKEMLKEMKNSLPKYEAAKNKAQRSLPDVTLNERSPSSRLETKLIKSSGDSENRGAIRKNLKSEESHSEALFVTTTSVIEDILVRKPSSSVHSSTADTKTGESQASLKKTRRRVGDGPFELMRARDLASIIESKSQNPAHVYANCQPVQKNSEVLSTSSSSDGSEVTRLANKLTRASGLAEFRASLDGSDADTLAVNRLLRRLEAAIAAGRHDQAATLARELASLKVSCSVTRQRSPNRSSPTPIVLDLYVEDKVSHQGPIPLRVHRSMTVSDLKMKVQVDLKIPCHVQRWILGKQLAAEDFRTLEELGVTIDKCPVFLYLVAPEPEPLVEPQTPSAPEEELGAVGGVAEKPAPMGKGWYYNYEEDRYSFCESDSEEQSPERPSPSEPSKTPSKQNTTPERNMNGQASKASSAKVVSILEKKKLKINSLESFISDVFSNGSAAQSVNADPSTKEELPKKRSPNLKRPPLKSSASLPESSPKPENKSDVIRNGSASGSSKNDSRPRSRSIFDLIKPQSSDTLKKDLKVISVNAVKETIEKLTRRTEDVQRNGWRCEVCTLINEPNRSGCAACMAPRPSGYQLPTPSPAEEELKRLRRNQDIDLPIVESGNAHYLELVGLDDADLVRNQEPFECPVCLVPQEMNEGVVLRECLHTFCRTCLSMTVEHSQEAEVKCPYRDDKYSCESVMQQREIKALVTPHVFEQHLARGVQQAENRMGNAFHCKTPDCGGWCILDDNVNEFTCPVCSKINCLTCQAVHQGMDCRTYQNRLNSSSDTNAEARRTRTMLEEMVQRGDAMACPTCQVVLMKKWGCDWLRCSMCKTEICWVTRGPRWGPNGKGDTSAGCQCGVNQVKCHPKCNYCH